MTAQVSQGGGRRVLRLGHQPDDDIAVGDNATDLVVFNDNHVANLGVPHGAGGLVHRGGAGPAPRGWGSSAHESAGPYATPWVEASVSDSAMSGSDAGGTGQAPHCPYRHGTARGAAPTSVEADCCPRAVVANGTVDDSTRGGVWGTVARTANRWLSDGIQQRYALVRKPAQACLTNPVGPSDCPALSLVTVSDTRRGRMVRFLLPLLSIGTMAPRLAHMQAAPWLTARRAHA
jgi:hypothetical protein